MSIGEYNIAAQAWIVLYICIIAPCLAIISSMIFFDSRVVNATILSISSGVVVISIMLCQYGDAIKININIFYIISIASTVVVIFVINKAAYQLLRKNLKKRWWSIGDEKIYKAPESWIDVFNLASVNKEFDPLVEENFSYKKISIQIYIRFSLFSIYIGLISGFIILGVLIDKVHYDLMPDVKVASVLVILSAVIAGSFAYYNLRAKTRADSRQIWINNVRELMSCLIFHVGQHLLGSPLDEKALREFHEKRVRLELNLNPSEKDHRLLMYFFRICTIPESKTIRCDANLREMVKETIEANSVDYCLQRIVLQGAVPACDGRHISDGECPKKSSFNTCVAYIDPHSGSDRRINMIQAQACGKQCCDNALSYMFNLSHAILKREWERVRSVQ